MLDQERSDQHTFLFLPCAAEKLYLATNERNLPLAPRDVRDRHCSIRVCDVDLESSIFPTRFFQQGGSCTRSFRNPHFTTRSTGSLKIDLKTSIGDLSLGGEKPDAGTETSVCDSEISKRRSDPPGISSTT